MPVPGRYRPDAQGMRPPIRGAAPYRDSPKPSPAGSRDLDIEFAEKLRGQLFGAVARFLLPPEPVAGQDLGPVPR